MQHGDNSQHINTVLPLKQISQLSDAYSLSQLYSFNILCCYSHILVPYESTLNQNIFIIRLGKIILSEWVRHCLSR